jgi:glycosyltransferase involved in cell wall biosynthesis
VGPVKKRPLLSVIIPAHNSEKYIRVGLLSVLSAPTKAVEVIVVDDGSRDRTAQIVNQLAREYSNLKLFSRPHCGPGAARNFGVSQCSGEYGVFLDSDDRLRLPSLLQQVVNPARQDNLDLALFNTTPVSRFPGNLSWRLLRFRGYYRRSRTLPTGIMRGPELAAELLERRSYLASPCLYVWKRDFIEACGVKFPEKIIMEDNYFTYVCLKKAQRAQYYSSVHHERLVRKTSLSQSSTPGQILEGYATTYGLMSRLQAEGGVTEHWERRVLGTIAKQCRATAGGVKQPELEAFRSDFSMRFRALPPF